MCAKDKKGGQSAVHLRAGQSSVAGAKLGRRRTVTAELAEWAVARCQAEEL